MRVLLDECVPRPLKRELPDHQVQTVGELRWSGRRNGDLLRLATDAGFDVFVTVDQNLPYQQNLEGSPIAVVILAAPSNELSDLLPLAPSLRQTLGQISPGQVVTLHSDSSSRREEGI
jgi:predicted nuclease of predicted toxin-antitoxin system